MITQKHLLAIAITSSLVACGGTSSDKKISASQPQAVEVTAENLSQALRIQGATPVSFTLPEDLDLETGIAGASVIVISANSSFALDLKVPESIIPANKQVAGYLLELPGGNKQFIPVASPSVASISDFSFSAPAKQVANEEAQEKHKAKKQMHLRAFSIQSLGVTRVIISGWNPASYNLDERIENLSMRIIPLFVNSSVGNIASLSFTQIEQDDGFEMSVVEEIALAVEAVATSPIQISLTWDTETDIDLYVIQPGYRYEDLVTDSDENSDYSQVNAVAFFNRISSKSLGWLDVDNTTAYGPENITFNYDLPPGTYHVGVNYFSGSPKTNYTVTIAIGSDVKTFSGTFLENSQNSGDMSGLVDASGNKIENEANIGSDIVYSFTANDVNSILTAKVPNSQYLGVYKLPEESSVQGYIEIESDGISAYATNDLSSFCSRFRILSNSNYLPTGFKVNSGLQVSDAILGGIFLDGEDGNSNYTYAYRNLTKVDESFVAGCSN